MKNRYEIFGIKFKSLQDFLFYMYSSHEKDSGLKRIEEKDKIVYIKGRNSNRYIQEFQSIITLERLIIMDMKNQKRKKVYIEFPEYIGIGTIFPKVQIEQINNFDPYPNISNILHLNTDSRTEYFKDKSKSLLNNF